MMWLGCQAILVNYSTFILAHHSVLGSNPLPPLVSLVITLTHRWKDLASSTHLSLTININEISVVTTLIRNSQPPLPRGEAVMKQLMLLVTPQPLDIVQRHNFSS
jgi:hypothetical protein